MQIKGTQLMTPKTLHIQVSSLSTKEPKRKMASQIRKTTPILGHATTWQCDFKDKIIFKLSCLERIFRREK